MAEAEFERLFERFKTMLAHYAKRLHVASQTHGMYGPDMAPGGDPRWGAAQRALR